VKVTLYARYSSDSQRDASIADQLRVCRIHAEKLGWDIVEEYTDHAVSGTSLLSPGIQALMADATTGRFQLVLTEAMDRLSRDQEDIAGFYKRMSFSTVKIVTLSEGEVSDLHIRLKGTMNALFLKDLAEKTRRGLRGRVELGKSGGGNAYGYDVVKKLDGDGNITRGDRTINETRAAVVRRIFRDYIAGKSGQRIAAELNKEGICAPTGGTWGSTTISGNPKRGTGILNNDLYVGKLIWNRQRFIKDPDTGKRQARLNPEAEWINQAVPELRIIDDELWNQAKERQGASRLDTTGAGKAEFWQHRRQKYMLSGLLRCGCCGGAYSMISTSMLGCSTARKKGTCDNRRNIRRDRLEERIMDALRHHLMDPALFAEFCGEFTKEVNRLRGNAGAAIAAARAELKKIDRDLDILVELILKGSPADRINVKMVKMEARQKELERELAQSQEPPPLLHPNMAHHYRVQLDNLAAALEHSDEHKRIEAGEVIRSLIDHISLTPEGHELKIDVRGDLAGILSMALERKKPASRAGSKGDEFADVESQLKMVAGARNHRYRQTIEVNI
jgi:DNA invertase Pin-like site-specific DNA recombinase